MDDKPKEREAKLVNMPEPGTDVVALLKLHNDVLKRVAAKLALEYNLKYRSDFVIKFQDWKRHAFRTRRMGSVVAIYFNVALNHPEFEWYLRQALLAVAAELDNRPLPELASRLRDREREYRDANRWLAAMPKLISRDECTVTEIYAVEVKHRRTGLIVRKEAKAPKFARMVYDAREELTEMIGAIDKAREQLDEEKLEQIKEELKHKDEEPKQ